MWIENASFGFEMGNVNGKWSFVFETVVVMSKTSRLCWKRVENGLIDSKIGRSRRKWADCVENGLIVSKMGRLCRK